MPIRSEEHTSELQSPCNLVCRLLLEKKKYYSSQEVRFARGDAMPRVRQRHVALARALSANQCMYSHLRSVMCGLFLFFFFFNDTATTEIYTLSLHDALPIFRAVDTERSTMRPTTYGPRSWMVTCALWPVSVLVTIAVIPSGSVLLAALSPCGSILVPSGISLPANFFA